MIKHFREMHLTSWPQDDSVELAPILRRLDALIPKVETQTHLLHLSERGEILPHRDNIDASGSWILGVSLGALRVLRMERRDDPDDVFEVLLKPGSVYIQKSVFLVATNRYNSPSRF